MHSSCFSSSLLVMLLCSLGTAVLDNAEDGRPIQNELSYQSRLPMMKYERYNSILFKPSLRCINHCQCQLNLQLESIINDLFFKVIMLLKNFLPRKLGQPSLHSNGRLNPVSELDCVFPFLEQKMSSTS